MDDKCDFLIYLLSIPIFNNNVYKVCVQLINIFYQLQHNDKSILVRNQDTQMMILQKFAFIVSRFIRIKKNLEPCYILKLIQILSSFNRFYKSVPFCIHIMMIICSC